MMQELAEASQAPPAPLPPAPLAADAPLPAYVAPVRVERPAREERPRRERNAEAPELDTQQLAEAAKRLTEELLSAMGFEATVAVTAESDRVDVTVEAGQDDDLLNGAKGETRQAIQQLLNRFLNKGEGSRYHLQLEVSDFWAKRESELETLAKSMAEQAVATNSEQVTDYLNSQERRIVHVTLKPDARVRTSSLGNGMVKRVAIAPADFPERTGEEG
jgi:spoIIIJ-associated protein